MASELVAHALELLAPLGRARAKRMFGGHGLYVDDVFVALIAFDRLYLKVDEQTRPRFEAAGCEPFVYVKPQKPALQGERPAEAQRAKLARPMTMSYWTVPPEAMESPALMQPWARLAMAAALRAKAAKPASKAPKPRATQHSPADAPRKKPAATKRTARKG